MEQHRQGLWAVHSAVLIFGLTALFSRVIELTALEITLLRSLIAAIAVWIFLYWNKQSIKLNNTKDLGVVVLMGVLLATHWVTYFHAMQIASVAVGAIALYTFPVITVFLEPLFHGERPRLKDIVSAFMVFIGIVMLVPEFSLASNITQGVLWGVLSAFLFSLRNIVQGKYFRHYTAKHSLFYQTVVTFIVLLPFSFDVVIHVTTEQWLQLLLLGIFFTALPHTLFAFSLHHLRAKTASLIACTQVVYATSFAWLFLDEWPGLIAIAGGTIIVVTAMYESYSTGNRTNKAATVKKP